MHPCEGTFITVSTAPRGASFPGTLLVPHKPECTAAEELFIRKQPRGGGRNFCFQRIKSARRRGERSLPTIARKYLEHKSRQKNWSLLLPLLVRTLHLRNTEKWGGEIRWEQPSARGDFCKKRSLPPSSLSSSEKSLLKGTDKLFRPSPTSTS